MDLVGAVGYYSLVSMVLNVAQVPAARGRNAAAEAAVTAGPPPGFARWPIPSLASPPVVQPLRR